eukprot:CAMPEP_0167763186 /NCGR_PEP_ID=MMETSP0110_2-20121227/13208_1 /TAXON_ID=629695 /ORGANISM="Gymnochlora sp., Strain CCMP2014" /LENGTH=178 /DNA_ID=CAMNT_0007650193 /DNA_START=382 /DNA_END=918 /DNA_ORIENTATION=-
MTIQAVEKKRESFSSITNDELQNRKAFVAETTTIVNGYRQLLNDPATKAKKEEDKREAEALRARRDEPTFSTAENDDPLKARTEQQQELEEKQDLALDNMQTVLERLGVAADAIDLEMGEQKELIAEMRDEIDVGKERMGATMKKLHKLLGTSSNSKLCCLLVMFLMVIILLAIAILG